VGDPYVVRRFSAFLRLYLEMGLHHDDSTLFPGPRRMNRWLRDRLDRTLFHGARLRLDTGDLRHRLMLELDHHRLPPMAWSTGQREFIPLLLGLYWLTASASTRARIRWVILEEPELGLHPDSLQTLMLILLDLLRQGYRLLISTHSSELLEMVWAITRLRESPNGVHHFRQLLGLDRRQFTTAALQEILTDKTYTTYFFHRGDPGPVTVKDISTLDPGDEDPGIADWGGLTAFASHASEVVAAAMAERQ